MSAHKQWKSLSAQRIEFHYFWRITHTNYYCATGLCLYYGIVWATYAFVWLLNTATDGSHTRVSVSARLLLSKAVKDLGWVRARTGGKSFHKNSDMLLCGENYNEGMAINFTSHAPVQLTTGGYNKIVELTSATQQRNRKKLLLASICIYKNIFYKNGATIHLNLSTVHTLTHSYIHLQRTRF